METVEDILKEDKRRHKVMFSGFNPSTGKLCPCERKRLHIPDYFIPTQYVTIDTYNDNLYKLVRKAGSMTNFLHSLGVSDDIIGERMEQLTKQMMAIRAKDDPAFGFFYFFKIQDKKTGQMIQFRLNYPQRLVLEELEGMRKSGVPIRLVILKARQWGGSTLVQLYMAWIQLFIKEGWYSVILAQTKDTSRRIKAMYTKVLGDFPSWGMEVDNHKIIFSPYEGSSSDSILTFENGEIARNNVISIASYENYDSVRGNSYAMAHYSETAFWKDTLGKTPEELIASVSGGILDEPLTMEVMESSARGSSGYFYDECQLAINGKSSRRFLFIPFFFIENDMKKIDNKNEFATWLLSVKDLDSVPEGCLDEGRYYWKMWTLGATLEHINWYITKRKSFHDHENMATEAPIDYVEAFKNSGKRVFSPYAIDDMRKIFVKEPIAKGDVHGASMKGIESIKNAKFYPSENGKMKIWAYPNTNINVRYRYVVSVDIGGKSEAADYSVITVIDRFGMMKGAKGLPKVVARWRGHIRHDYLAWKAAAIARYYCNAYLIFESNTYDMEKSKNTEGEHMTFILDEVGGAYENMYYRHNDSETIEDNYAVKWGWQTNKTTKPKMVDNMVVYLDDQLWDEPDDEMYKEMLIYEYKDDGTIGNIEGKGNHDDIFMSTGIGLYVSQYEMELPVIISTPAQRVNVIHTRIESDIV